MGGSWLMEILSWAVGGPPEIWIITDAINCSRGALIFYFCVWSNKKVRNYLLSRFTDKYTVQSGSEKSGSSKVSVLSYASVSQNVTLRQGDADSPL
jgi:hypothetical protein